MRNQSKNLIRAQLRQIRQDLSLEARQQAAQNLKQRVINSLIFQDAYHIAVYSPTPEEINPNGIIETALNLGKKLYLPAISSHVKLTLSFRPYIKDMPLIANRYGILEPPLEAKQTNINFNIEILDLVLVPLVGFDAQGHRLGMGKGYYDRTFENIKNRHPFLLGLAFECQKVDSIPVNDKDVILNAIFSDQNTYLV